MKQQSTIQNKQSALAKFKLGYEYDVTWREAAKDIRDRAEEI